MKRIVFVDDDAAVLGGIQTRLHRRRKEWQMEFADSGAKALTLLERQPADLVCSDMRMPGMDGAQLLSAVRERWPETARIVLSGYSEIMQTNRSVSVAHHYLSKPCSAELLQHTIERCLAVRELVHRPALCSSIDAMTELSDTPRIYAELRDAATRADITAADVARIVGSDAALAHRIVAAANSPIFRLTHKVANVEMAATQLGIPALRNLTIAIEALTRHTANEHHSALYEHALATCAAARVLSTGTAFVDDAIVAAMLRDVGILALETSSDWQKALELARCEGIPLVTAEQRILGASHAEVAAALLARWGLSYTIVEAVALHHEPLAMQHSEYGLLGAVALADALMHDSDPFHLSAKPTLDASTLTALRAPFSLDKALNSAAEVKTAFTTFNAAVE